MLLPYYKKLAISIHISISKQPVQLQLLLSILNLTTIILSITTFQMFKLISSNRFKTLAHAVVKLPDPLISLPFSGSLDWLKVTECIESIFLLLTKFLLPHNLHVPILTTSSLFNPLVVSAPHLLSPLLAHQLFPHWKSLICITSSLESASRFVLATSPVVLCFTSSCICQVVFHIVTTFSIHCSHTLSLPAQNLFHTSFPP